MDELREWFIDAIARQDRDDLEAIAQTLGVPVQYRRGKLKIFKTIKDVAKALNK